MPVLDMKAMKNIYVNESKEFESKISKIIEFNEGTLRKAYLHPFQRVNKKLYSENGGRFSVKSDLKK